MSNALMHMVMVWDLSKKDKICLLTVGYHIKVVLCVSWLTIGSGGIDTVAGLGGRGRVTGSRS